MINANSKISFVVPAYNCADTITESIDSIFNGNFENGDEVIIVNDASGDSTAEIIQSLQKKYPHIKIINNIKNVGCPASRNVGIRSAFNPLIFNLDADNILVPGSIERLKNYLLAENADLAAFSEYHYFQKNIRKINHKWIYKSRVMTLADFLAGPINPGPGGNFLYTKESWEKVGGYPENLDTCEDLVFDRNLKSKGLKFKLSKNAFVYWPQRENIWQAIKQFFNYAVGDGRARFFRPQTPYLFLRYIFGLYLLFLIPIMKSLLLITLCITLLILYCIWSILKNYKYVNDLRALFYLPILQFASDFTVIIGTVIGFIKQ